MKLVIASDIHGAASWCERLVSAIADIRPDYVALLGDLLYHGPRNDIPADYDPKRVIELLSSVSPLVVAVRGNCDAEVDQMVLPFPIMADSNLILDGTRRLFLTHGHVFGPGLHNSVKKMPQLNPGDAMLYGHTHIKVNEVIDGITVFNPGSVGIPKDGTHSFGVYEGGRFEHRILG